MWLEIWSQNLMCIFSPPREGKIDKWTAFIFWPNPNPLFKIRHFFATEMAIIEAACNNTLVVAEFCATGIIFCWAVWPRLELYDFSLSFNVKECWKTFWGTKCKNQMSCKTWMGKTFSLFWQCRRRQVGLKISSHMWCWFQKFDLIIQEWTQSDKLDF